VLPRLAVHHAREGRIALHPGRKGAGLSLERRHEMKVNVLARLNAAPAPQTAAGGHAATGRHGTLRQPAPAPTSPRRSAMTRDLTLELKKFRLHGMAGAWAELQEQGRNAYLDSSRWRSPEAASEPRSTGRWRTSSSCEHLTRSSVMAIAPQIEHAEGDNVYRMALHPQKAQQ